MLSDMHSLVYTAAFIPDQNVHFNCPKKINSTMYLFIIIFLCGWKYNKQKSFFILSTINKAKLKWMNKLRILKLWGLLIYSVLKSSCL